MRKRRSNDLGSAEAFRIPDAAARYSVGTNVLRDAIKRGELEASKLGDAPRSPVIIRRVKIEEWIESRRIRPVEAQAA
jgi:hypothetical protein